MVGIIGSSNNPISGLTLTALVTTALILVVIGVDSHCTVVLQQFLVLLQSYVSLPQLQVKCLQDLKAGHILGGTPWKMQVGDIIGVVVSGLVMFYVLNLLNQADIAQGLQQNYQVDLVARIFLLRRLV
ncbi:MAG: OPT/YSL family transporter [Ignavibacteriales bacterium]|nr:OPT/YSL family transporter [Ignavibacteriales bacterium]